MAIELTPEQEKALLLLLDREMNLKIVSDAVIVAEAALAEVNSRFVAEQKAANDGVIAKYTAELRSAQQAVSDAYSGKQAIDKPIDISAADIKEVAF